MIKISFQPIVVAAVMIAAMALVPAMAMAEGIDLSAIARGHYASRGMGSIHPLASGDTWAELSADGRRVVERSFADGREVGTLFSVETARGASLQSIDGFIMGPGGKKMLIQTATQRIYRRSKAATYYLCDIASGRLEPLSDGGPQQAPIFSPDGTMVAFVRQGNIYLVKMLYDNAESQVTTDGRAGEVINGVPDWVSEEELGLECCMAFSADSRQLCWIRYDESQVRQVELPLYGGSHPTHGEYATYPGEYAYKYPKAGEQNAVPTVHSFDIKSRQVRQLQVPLAQGDYVARLAATSDATRMAVITLNRHQDVMSIYMANPLSTVCQLAVQERADRYVEEGVLGQIRFTQGNMVLPSSRNGKMHLYLYTLGGQLVRQLDPGDHVATACYGYDEATGDTYFQSTMLGPADRQVCVARKNGRVERLTNQSGVNSAVFSANYKRFVCTWSNINTPTTITLRSNAGKTLATLDDGHEVAQKMQQLHLGDRQLFAFTTSEGVELKGWMVKPASFSPSAQYPVIMYQYGGPGSQQVLDSWNIGMMGQGAIFEQYLAAQGYVVVCVDGRGTGGRGSDFEKCTYMRLGELEARDQVETALWLATQQWVDKERIGIWGWSYGGWNTLMSMSEGRPVFRAGVAVAPVTSWRYYDTIYTERYMRTPQENPQGYDQVCPLARVDKLSGALLICHGLADDNVHYQNTAEYVEALVQADKDFKMNIYTNRNHSIYGGNTRHHLLRQIVNFFNDELKAKN